MISWLELIKTKIGWYHRPWLAESSLDGPHCDREAKTKLLMGFSDHISSNRDIGVYISEIGVFRNIVGKKPIFRNMVWNSVEVIALSLLIPKPDTSFDRGSWSF